MHPNVCVLYTVYIYIYIYTHIYMYIYIYIYIYSYLSLSLHPPPQTADVGQLRGLKPQDLGGLHTRICARFTHQGMLHDTSSWMQLQNVKLNASKKVKVVTFQNLAGCFTKRHIHTQMRTNFGDLNLEIRADFTPMTAENFLTLCDKGYLLSSFLFYSRA